MRNAQLQQYILVHSGCRSNCPMISATTYTVVTLPVSYRFDSIFMRPTFYVPRLSHLQINWPHRVGDRTHEDTAYVEDSFSTAVVTLRIIISYKHSSRSTLLYCTYDTQNGSERTGSLFDMVVDCQYHTYNTSTY